MGAESIMYVLVGTCLMAGTVYLYLVPDAVSSGTRPLDDFRLEDFQACHSSFEASYGGMKREGGKLRGL